MFKNQNNTILLHWVAFESIKPLHRCFDELSILFFLFSYINLFCNDLMSYSLSGMLCSIHTTLLTISPCLQACFYLKAFILIAAGPEISFPQIYSYLSLLKTLGLTIRFYWKLQFLMNTSYTSLFPYFFFHNIYTENFYFCFH